MIFDKIKYINRYGENYPCFNYLISVQAASPLEASSGEGVGWGMNLNHPYFIFLKEKVKNGHKNEHFNKCTSST